MSLRPLRCIAQRRVKQATPLGILRAFPVTTVLLIAIVLIGRWTADIATSEYRQVLERWGLDYEMVRDGRLYHLFTGTFVQSEPGIALSMIVVAGSALALCELIAGSRWTLIAFLTVDWAASLLTVLTLRALAAAGNASAAPLLDIPDAGSSAAAHGAYAVAALLLPGTLGILAYGLLVVVTILVSFHQHLAPSLAHLYAVGLGGLLGAWLRSRTLRDPEDGSMDAYANDHMTTPPHEGVLSQ